MENQPVFSRILMPERGDRLESEISLRSVRIILECNDVVYDVMDNLYDYIDDDYGIMLAHLWCE